MADGRKPKRERRLSIEMDARAKNRRTRRHAGDPPARERGVQLPRAGEHRRRDVRGGGRRPARDQGRSRELSANSLQEHISLEQALRLPRRPPMPHGPSASASSADLRRALPRSSTPTLPAPTRSSPRRLDSPRNTSSSATKSKRWRKNTRTSSAWHGRAFARFDRAAGGAGLPARANRKRGGRHRRPGGEDGQRD